MSYPGTRRPAPLALALVACLLPLSGCDFFKELKGNESETGEGSTESETGETGETGTSGEASESGDEPCMIGVNDSCISQDLLSTCAADSDEFVTFDCAAACSPNLNVSCLTVGAGNSCWCASPGNNKIDTCPQLETCLDNCGENAFETCGEGCFARTDAQTIRLLGALIACAESSCEVACAVPGAACTNCLFNARAGLIGDCALERSICDQDPSGDSWP